MARILITGATRGIGRALFDAYTARGDDVTGTYRDTAPTGGSWARLDVTEAGDLRNLKTAMGDRPLDLLICNAGVYLDKGHHLADGYDASLWAETFATNVTGVFQTIQTLLPNLAHSNAGKIVIMSSQMASSERAPGGSYIYRASKAAVLNLGRNLASELKPRHIAVGIYHPGWVQTDMGGGNADISAEDSRDGLMARFDALTMASSGEFKTWDGVDHPY
ncbi:MAG: SDR family NAD(P)-dependent oxidoreductase [Pseudomonadota bacterium]